MNGDCFVDTNLLVYFRDASEPEKQPLARQWMGHLWKKQLGRLSYQVLSEYYVTVTNKLKPGLDMESARRDVINLMAWKPIPVDAMIMETAWRIQDRYVLSWWDSLIVAAALKIDCSLLLSEDLQHEQTINSLTIINPFLCQPDKLLS